MDRYEDMFVDRGSAYDRAMRRHPSARREEFAQVVDRLDARPGQTVADVPAGGGYLGEHLPAGVLWSGHEPCVSFHGGNHGAQPQGRPLFPFPWADASVDHLVCLAGLHHQSDRAPFHAEVARVLRPGGRYVLSDVPAGSAVSQFLDGFVGAHNSTGHSGIYLDDGTAAEVAVSGLRVLSDETVRFHWRFRDRTEMGVFCHGLFDLRTVGPEEVARRAEEILGVDALEDGVGLRWELRTVVSVRPAA